MWLTDLLKLANGLASHDTFERGFARLYPKPFEASFVEWVKGIITIEGKTLRRSHDHVAGKKALHVVSSLAVENHLGLAQIATEEKSNEITTIPVLLRQFALNGCIVTIDAMGTQTKIAEQIIKQQGEYGDHSKSGTDTLFCSKCNLHIRG
ncbi:MAG: hypothetical protein NVS4B11_13080 [Ktedonobacteraceae bacterium]